MSERQKPGPAPRFEDAKRLTITLDAATLERIRDRAEKGKTTSSEIVRRLIRKAMR